jgi:hypothetical protein
MWSHLTNGHIWPSLLITLVEPQQFPVKHFEVKNYALGGSLKILGLWEGAHYLTSLEVDIETRLYFFR